MSLWWFEYLKKNNGYSEYSYLQKASQTHHSCHLAVAALTVAWFCFSVSYLRDKTLCKEASRSELEHEHIRRNCRRCLFQKIMSSLISKLANMRFCKPGGPNNLLIPDPWKFTSNWKSLKYWFHHPQKRSQRDQRGSFWDGRPITNAWVVPLELHNNFEGTRTNLYSQQQMYVSAKIALKKNFKNI